MTAVKLQSWEDVPDHNKFRTIVLGNGHSISFHSGFGYRTLLEEASFTGSRQALFDNLGTSDFEFVLESLHSADQILRIMDPNNTVLGDAYNEIRTRLFEVVAGIHCEYQWPRLLSMSNVLADYRKIFSTNYDLLLYWGAMAAEPHFADFFSPTFRFENGSWNPKTGVYFVHGALHIWHEISSGIIGKYTRDDENMQGLLEVINQSTPGESGRHPLFVSEGTSEQKRDSIRRSKYLEFAYRELEADCQNTVVFGSRLAPTDDHILRALGANRQNEGRRIAISRHLETEDEVETRRWSEIREWLESRENSVSFFEARSHPLGMV